MAILRDATVFKTTVSEQLWAVFVNQRWAESAHQQWAELVNQCHCDCHSTRQSLNQTLALYHNLCKLYQTHSHLGTVGGIRDYASAGCHS